MVRTARTEPQCLYKGDLYLYFAYFEHLCILPQEDNYMDTNSGVITLC